MEQNVEEEKNSGNGIKNSSFMLVFVYLGQYISSE